uniref:hypothetical protein n=1 Tax=Pseudomonas sp. TaxID=306 RepID=UPI00258A79FD
MTTRNFRVHNGISVGDIEISASNGTITGMSTAAPSSDGDVANKKYVDDQINTISTTAITSGSTNATVNSTSLVVTAEGNTELTVTDAGVRVHGNLTVDGTETILNTTTLSVEDNIIEVNRNVSSNAGMPTISGMKVNRGEGSTATENDIFWAWDESYADDGTTTFGNAGGAWTAFRSANAEVDALVDIRANVVHALSTSAQYADVAERFEADAPMSAGAVVEVGGTAEITESTTDDSKIDRYFVRGVTSAGARLFSIDTAGNLRATTKSFDIPHP